MSQEGAASSPGAQNLKHIDLWEWVQRITEMIRGIEYSTSRVRKGWENGIFQPGKEKVLEWPTCSFPVPEENLKDGEGLLTERCNDRTRGNSFQVSESGFRSDNRQDFFTQRVVMHQHRLPREALLVPHPRKCSRLDWLELWAAWFIERCPHKWQRTGTTWSWRSLCNPNFSPILWFYDTYTT